MSIQSEIKSYLSSVLPKHRAFALGSEGDTEPLWYVECSNVLVCFAIYAGSQNVDTESFYDIEYRQFKSHLNDKYDDYAAFDIAFVLCVAEDQELSEDFVSAVEMDTYFCRKYVITIGSSLEQSFIRLPFVPLTKSTNLIPRPKSIGTYLKQINVGEELSRQVVSASPSSPKQIVEEWAKIWQPPLQQPTAAKTEETRATNPRRVVLSSVTVENFRSYGDRMEIDFGADVTVLYGPNGYGKTSLLDAIDFVATGGVGRLAGSESAESNMLLNLNAPTNPGTVTVNFSSDGVPHEAVRHVQAPKSPMLDWKWVDAKEALIAVMGATDVYDWPTESLISLFRSTHIFMPDYQELANNFRTGSRLDNAVVSRILGTEGHFVASNVIRSVIEDIDGELEKLNQNSRTLAREQELISSVTSSNDKSIDEGPWRQRFDEMHHKLMEFDIKEDSSRTEVETIKLWRTSLLTRLNENASEQRELSHWRTVEEGISEREKSLERIEIKLQSAIRELDALKENITDLKIRVMKCREVLTQAKKNSETAQKALLVLEWFVKITEHYKTLTDRLQGSSQKLRLTRNKLANDFAPYTIDADEMNVRISYLSQQLDSLFALEKKLESIRAKLEREHTLADQDKSIESELRQFEEKADELRLKLNDVEQVMQQRTEGIERDKNVVQQIFSQLEPLLPHINTDVCPLCGIEHGSKEQLIIRIQNRMTNVKLDSASQTARDLSLLKQTIKGQYENALRHQSGVRQKSDEIKQELRAIDLTWQDIIKSYSEIVGDGRDCRSNPISWIAETKTRLTHALILLKKNLDDLGEIKHLELSIKHDQEELEILKHDILLRGLSLQQGRAELDVKLTTIKAEIEQYNADVVSETNCEQDLIFKLEAETTAAGRVEQFVTELLQSRDSVQDDILRLRTQQSDRLDLGTDDVKLRIQTLVQAERQLTTLSRDVDDLAMTLQIVETAASRRHEAIKLDQVRKSIAQCTTDIARMTDMRDYFEKLQNLISGEQLRIIEEFINEYGNRTSAIQSRLRPVYGFSDTELTLKDGGIGVKVKHRSAKKAKSTNMDKLTPTDYFSQSQTQILLMGLFLNVSMSQSWSGFAPIFLDDPVTHFDDLNTYCLLDLIQGFILSEPVKRQFVISTCNERLYRNAQRKFRHLNAVFYEFKGLSASGPIVEKIGRSQPAVELTESSR